MTLWKARRQRSEPKGREGKGARAAQSRVGFEQRKAERARKREGEREAEREGE